MPTPWDASGGQVSEFELRERLAFQAGWEAGRLREHWFVYREQAIYEPPQLDVALREYLRAPTHKYRG